VESEDLPGVGESGMAILSSENLAEEGRLKNVGGGVRVVVVVRFVGEVAMDDKLTREPLFNPEENNR